MKLFAVIAASVLSLGFGLKPAQSEEVCPASQRLTLDLDAWVAATRQAKKTTDLEKALAALGLKPTGEPGGDAFCESQAVLKLQVDLFSPTLRDEKAGRVVQVLATICPEASEFWQVQRGAAFVPVGTNEWCRVEMPFLDRTGSDYGPQLCKPAVFAFTNLTSAKHVAVKVTDTEDWCGTSGSGRGSKTTISFWEVQGWKFASLLSVQTFRAYYNSPIPPIETLTATLRLSGGYPKVVDRVEKVTCDDPGLEERRENPELQHAFKACKQRKVRSRCEYSNGVYTCKP